MKLGLLLMLLLSKITFAGIFHMMVIVETESGDQEKLSNVSIDVASQKVSDDQKTVKLVGPMIGVQFEDHTPDMAAKIENMPAPKVLKDTLDWFCDSMGYGSWDDVQNVETENTVSDQVFAILKDSSKPFYDLKIYQANNYFETVVVKSFVCKTTK